MVPNFVGGETKMIDSKYVNSPTETLEDLVGWYVFSAVSNGVMEGIDGGV